MTDVKLFTHAFSANVLTKKVHSHQLKHDGSLPNEFLKVIPRTSIGYRTTQCREEMYRPKCRETQQSFYNYIYIIT